jgi:hypothetical protein
VGVTTGGRESAGRHRRRRRRWLPYIAGSAGVVALAVALAFVLLPAAGSGHPGRRGAVVAAWCGPLVALVTSREPDSRYQAAMQALGAPAAPLLAAQRALRAASAAAVRPGSPSPSGSPLAASGRVTAALGRVASACGVPPQALRAGPHSAW